MPLRSSTGRASRVKHSTGTGPDKVTTARRGHPRTRYSTGDSAAISHVTGREADYRALGEDSDVPQDKVKQAPATPQGR